MNTDTDYLIVGAGTGGLAFADTLLAQTKDATITIVDERAAPGGHWVDAYDFVRLHQPSAFYGVNSTVLGGDRVDTEGLNAGFAENASGGEVRVYFNDVMNRVLLPSGRVRYLPSSTYDFERRTITTNGETQSISARKVVDTTYVGGPIPSRHTPNYSIAPGMRHVPVNALSRADGKAKRYVILGAGKTGMDAVVFLLQEGVAPEAITWIMPQDVWFYNRALFQPGEQFLDQLFTTTASQMEIAARATSVDEVLLGLEENGTLMRLDRNVMPGAYRCATVTSAEMDVARRVTNVVRMGRVKRIETERIVLERGEIPTGPDVLHVDCTAKAVRPRPVVPIFNGDHIIVQFVRMCQPSFAASFIAMVEAHFDDEAKKNALCGVVPNPERAIEWLSMTVLSSKNAFVWMQEPVLAQWLATARVNGMRGLMRPKEMLTPAQAEARKRQRKAMPAALVNMAKLLAEAQAPTRSRDLVDA